MPENDYGLFTIGAGSGGVRASRIAAGYGAKVAVAEAKEEVQVKTLLLGESSLKGLPRCGAEENLPAERWVGGVAGCWAQYR